MEYHSLDDETRERRTCRIQKRHWLVILCSFGALVAYADRTNIAVCVIPMSKEYGWSSSTSGFVMSAFFYGYVCTQVAGGYMSTKWGGKRVLAWGVALWSLFTFLTPLAASNLFSLAICRVCFGLVQGVCFPSIMTMFARYLRQDEQTRANALVLAFTYLGAIVGNVTSAQIVATWGWRAVFYIFGCIGVLWLIPWIMFDPSPVETQRLSDDVELESPMIRHQKMSDEDLFATASESPRDRSIPWAQIFAAKQVWALIVAQFCQSWGFWLVVVWLPSYYESAFHVDLANIGYFTIVPYFVQGMVALATGSLGDYLIYKRRFSKLRVRQVMQAASMLGMAIFMVIASTVAKNIVEGMIYITLAMGVYNLHVAGMAINHLDIAPKHAGVVYGIGNTAGQIPGIIGVWLTGFLLDITNHNWAVVFSLAAIICVIGSIVWVKWCGVEPIIDD
jgi:MFS transporter, ACS family, solute carrier family 17 (sodium-dependent inorganic phosphate cotransporter), other